VVIHNASWPGQQDPGLAWQVPSRPLDENVDVPGLYDALQIPTGEGCPVRMQPERDLSLASCAISY
jgi:hypothetical protein